MLISVSIEFLQIFLPRTSSSIDVFNNTLSAIIGVWITYSIKSYDPKRSLYFFYNFGKSVYFWIIFIYTLLITLIFLTPSFLNTFDNWETDYHLLVGNEKTMDRAWQGNIYKVSIFDRVLKKNEIDAYFKTGYAEKTFEKNSNGVLVEHVFENVPVNNYGSTGDELALFIKNGSLINKFADQNGLRIKGNSLLQSKSSAEKLVAILQKTNQFSIAIWIKPAHLKMMGPARIISLSTDPANRNFTLGQTQDRINFRVRTPLTGNNGSKVSLTSSRILNTRKPQLVVATFYRGEARLYYKNHLDISSIFDTSFYLPLLTGGKRARHQIFIFCFILLFPLGWLAWGLSSTKLYKRCLSVSITLLPFFISSFIKIILYQHFFDVHLFFLSVVISFLVLGSGLFCEFVIFLITKSREVF